MKAQPPLLAPEPLRDQEHGQLIAAANRDFETGLDEVRAFRRLTERLEKRKRGRALSLQLGAAAAMVSVFLLALGARHRHYEPLVQPEITAELPRTTPETRARASGRAQDAPASLPTIESEGQRAAKAATNARVPAARRASAAAIPSALRELAAAASSASEAPDCLSFARNGSPHSAEDCFLKRANGSGLGAEMALYEVARLRRDVLGDPNGALQALTEYRRRFPRGSLRHEADTSQLELLIQLGHTQAALQQSAELLASSGTERASELHLLRGHIYRKSLSDCRTAAREYAAATASVEALYYRATCLDAMGEREGAVAAFEAYLARGGDRFAADARKRLAELAP